MKIESFPIQPLETALPQSMQPELRYAGPRIEAATVVPPTETLGSPEFVAERASGLRGMWQKAKEAIRTVGDHFAIEAEGYRLSPTENIKARLGRFAVIGQAMRVETNEERSSLMANLDGTANPAVRSALNRHQDRKERQKLSSDENFANRTWMDTAKVSAHEVLLLAPVRMMGLMAIHGAAKFAEQSLTSDETITGKVATGLRQRSAHRLNVHQLGYHNPTLRKLDGMTKQDVKFSKVKASHAAKAGVAAQAAEKAARNPFTDN